MEPPAEIKSHPEKIDAHPTNVCPGPANVDPAPVNVQPEAMQIPPPAAHIPPGPPNPPVVYYSHMPPLGRSPVCITCPSCRTEIRSVMDLEPSTTTHIIACITCLICCPFTCLPYFIDDCKNVNHYCPKCNTFLGTYKH